MARFPVRKLLVEIGLPFEPSKDAAEIRNLLFDTSSIAAESLPLSSEFFAATLVCRERSLYNISAVASHKRPSGAEGQLRREDGVFVHKDDYTPLKNPIHSTRPDLKTTTFD